MTEFSLNHEFENLVRAILTEEQQLINSNDNSSNNMTHKDQSAKSPDFFQGNNAIKKKEKYKALHDYKDKVEKFLIKHLICWD